MPDLSYGATLITRYCQDKSCSVSKEKKGSFWVSTWKAGLSPTQKAFTPEVDFPKQLFCVEQTPPSHKNPKPWT